MKHKSPDRHVVAILAALCFVAVIGAIVKTVSPAVQWMFVGILACILGLAWLFLGGTNEH